ncbi:MAG: oxidoreductase [Sphingomicrobium sp.]|nr:oxidoreductase [Sphingomonadales bacterium]
MTDIGRAGTYRLGDREVRRMGYGAMQLAGPGVFGPPRDRAEAVAVLREAVGSGVDHIDTSDYYGPFVTNEIIREALAPYPGDLVIVTKLGARRTDDGGWVPWNRPEDLAQGLRDNLDRLGLGQMFAVNLRIMGDGHGPSEGSVSEQFEAMAKLQQQGHVRHLGISNVTRAQVEEALSIAPVACVQNMYNLVHREDDQLIDWLAGQGIAYVPFFPLGGFSPIQSQALSTVASELNATPMQVALAWLLQRAPNILLIPGTSSRAHLRENLEATELNLPGDMLTRVAMIGNAVRA